MIRCKVAEAALVGERQDVGALMNGSSGIVKVAMLILSLAACAQGQPTRMKTTMPSSEQQILSKGNLDRVKRYILESGERCTYSNRYNNNPCVRLPQLSLYLNPDPGPDGHPQWNINCDITRGDFNTLVVHEEGGDSAYHTVDFRGADAIVLKGRERAAESEMLRSKLVLERAVLAVLQRVDAGASSPEEAKK
ncbi:uncharacterized protein SOCEGT47_063720 [Sorangium cellulosum]|uniref:Uncharacterized protein n=2 Tax=Sorangium cellulosum TaxID=56 RepID=A0A4P2Q8I0_SORCE|nr:uncharacterized protein SOCEGT47_063720 [Sorangium cellulosum]